MSTPIGDEFEAEVRAELEPAEASDPARAAAQPASGWLFDPAEVEAEEIELRNLLNAVGGSPRLDAPELLPPHPRRLPHGDPSLELSLLPFSAAGDPQQGDAEPLRAVGRQAAVRRHPPEDRLP